MPVPEKEEKGMKNGSDLEQKCQVVALKIVVNARSSSGDAVFFEKPDFHIL